jgi:hypothetical protein
VGAFALGSGDGEGHFWLLSGIDMKAFLNTTGTIFGLMTVVHVWRAIDEWPHQGASLGFILGMTALIAVPGALSVWSWCCLRKLRAQIKKKGSDDSAA